VLLKPLACYFAGVVTVALAFSAASANPGRLGFGLGILTTVLGLGWALGSRNRALRAGNLLLRIAGPQLKVVKRSVQAPEPKKPDGRVFAQVVMALKGLGTDLESARWAAGQATCHIPDGGLDETLKLAIQFATGREAV
jgi:hypothetical protein